MYVCFVCVSLCRVTGVLRGAAPCFFGYVGYDEVCCLSSEVADPKRTVPRAVFGTIFAVTVIYCLASIALVGMHDYRTLDLHSGFAGAFRLAIWVFQKQASKEGRKEVLFRGFHLNYFRFLCYAEIAVWSGLHLSQPSGN